MKNTLILVFSLFISCNAFSQVVGIDTFVNPHPNAVFINPLAMFGFYQSSIELGYERWLQEYWAIEGSIGIGTPAYPWQTGGASSPGRTEGKGGSIRILPKYLSESFFVGWSSNYTWHNYHSTRFREVGTDELIGYNVRQRAFGTGVAVGGKMENDRIFLEISTGAGFRFLFITNDTSEDVHNLPTLNRFNFYIEPEEDGRYVRFTIPLNLKVGYRF